jgi:hypothetical protein
VLINETWYKCITRTAALPLGYQATFRWTKAGGLNVEWQPTTPCIRSARHWRRLFDAYSAARRQFFRDVATTLGGAVMIADLTGETEVIRPGTRH